MLIFLKSSFRLIATLSSMDILNNVVETLNRLKTSSSSKRKFLDISFQLNITYIVSKGTKGTKGSNLAFEKEIEEIFQQF